MDGDIRLLSNQVVYFSFQEKVVQDTMVTCHNASKKHVSDNI